MLHKDDISGIVGIGAGPRIVPPTKHLLGEFWNSMVGLPANPCVDYQMVKSTCVDLDTDG